MTLPSPFLFISSFSAFVRHHHFDSSKFSSAFTSSHYPLRSQRSLTIHHSLLALKLDKCLKPTSLLCLRPRSYSVLLDTFSDSLSPHNCSRNLRLRDAVLAIYHHNEVKFLEVTLDTFRMLQCLEWEPCVLFYQSNLT
ncbi:hypothetical protein G4B88_008926 [Cannabis sativa]|uniref:Uncharacterized protein n=1 Tax=Cannabis sativa TaxID=3483 RepID=A0A7J6DLZ0_CANSA|nr:hypothetical protein G4B88_002253 [Cannabis sativa]KAF4397080.1 hypothetical protein G4B88_008926 [Cannabis sativa]